MRLIIHDVETVEYTGVKIDVTKCLKPFYQNGILIRAKNETVFIKLLSDDSQKLLFKENLDLIKLLAKME